jgi:hypothetical protein
VAATIVNVAGFMHYWGLTIGQFLSYYLFTAVLTVP